LEIHVRVDVNAFLKRIGKKWFYIEEILISLKIMQRKELQYPCPVTS
jgi:hypothetical protein